MIVNFHRDSCEKINSLRKLKFLCGWLIKKVFLLMSLYLKGGVKVINGVFCREDETIDHLFFGCSAASLMWSLIKCAFGLKSICATLNVCLGNWLGSFTKNDKKAGACWGCSFVLDSLKM